MTPRSHGCLCSLLAAALCLAACGTTRPNVVLVITDDQGYGDLGVHGNPVLRTPNLDRLAAQSVELTQFCVSPVCAPTRASLLTGRCNYRTGVVDTYLGRAMMFDDEVTLAEALAAAGYRAGVFGKWHLGDNHPMRPIDQGFAESLVHKGGGIGQPSDPPGGDSYFGPTLLRDGEPVKTKGYCSDVFTDAAIGFVERNRERPFFLYLAFNAPHDPLQVPRPYLESYLKEDLSPARFPAAGHPPSPEVDRDALARVYGMVTNVDDNVGRLMAKLDELKLADDTVVVFLTDNGPAQARYNAGLRGRKGTLYEGGIRVPCFVRWPGRLEAGRKVDRLAAHVDWTPTLLDACGAVPPGDRKLDGVSLLPLLKGEVAPADWTDRTLYFQWHRGDEPQVGRAFAARSQRWKLLQAGGAGEGPFDAGKAKAELYDLEADPYEINDLAAQRPEVVGRMRRGYEAWFKDVTERARNSAMPVIVVGSRENPTVLTR